MLHFYRPIENFFGRWRSNRKQPRNFGLFIGIGQARVSLSVVGAEKENLPAAGPIDPSWKRETNDLNISDLSGDHDTPGLPSASLYFVSCSNSMNKQKRQMKSIFACMQIIGFRPFEFKQIHFDHYVDPDLFQHKSAKLIRIYL